MRLRKYEAVDLQTLLDTSDRNYVQQSDRFPHKTAMILIGSAAAGTSVVITYGIYEFSTYVVEPVIVQKIEPSPSPTLTPTPENTTPSPSPTDLPEH